MTAATSRGLRFLPADPWARAAAVLWGLLLALYGVKVWRQPFEHTVYPIFTAAADHWWQRVSLYSLYDGLDLYRYSPAFAVAMTPFALLPNWLGSVLWTSLSVGLLLAGMNTLLREVLPGAWPQGRQGRFLVLALAGSVRGIWSGQSNALLLALALFAAAAILRRRWWTASALLMAAVAIKVWPIALVLLLAALRPRRLIGRCLAVGGGFAAVPFLAAPPSYVFGQYREWARHLVESSDLRWAGIRDARTILETVVPVDASWFAAAQAASALAVLAWCWWQSRRGVSEGRLLTYVLAAWAGWQLLFGPASERLLYGLIAPFTSWAVLASPVGGGYRLLSWGGWLLTSLLGTGEVERALAPFFGGAQAVQPFGVVVFLAWLLLYARGDADRQEPGSASPAAPPRREATPDDDRASAR